MFSLFFGRTHISRGHYVQDRHGNVYYVENEGGYPQQPQRMRDEEFYDQHRYGPMRHEGRVRY